MSIMFYGMLKKLLAIVWQHAQRALERCIHDLRFAGALLCRLLAARFCSSTKFFNGLQTSYTQPQFATEGRSLKVSDQHGCKWPEEEQ